MSRLLLLVGAAYLVSCDKRTDTSNAAPPRTADSAKVEPATVSLGEEPKPRPFRFPKPERLVAIGDVHGDLNATRAALRLAGAIDGDDGWAGGELVVVQTGDQLDRGNDEREIVDLFDSLARQAEHDGGRVHALNGNHEIMNVMGDFRYVTPEGFRDFAELAVRSKFARAAPDMQRNRAAAFLPGGEYARRLALRDVVVVVGDTVFVHGGVLPSHVKYGLGRINAENSRWMSGWSPQPPTVLLEENAPVWTRNYGLPDVPGPVCKTLGSVLDALDAKRMVVGHTVQKAGVTSACDERVWRIDVGLSKFYGHDPVQVLEIQGDQVRVLTAKG